MAEELDLEEYEDRANKHFSRGEYSDAEYFYKQIVKITPENWRAWYNRGVCLMWEELYDTASVCFEEVIKYSPKYVKAWYYLGFSQAQIGDIENALFNLNHTIKLDPNHFVAIGTKAWIFFQEGNEKNSKMLIDYVLKKNPKFSDQLNKQFQHGFATDMVNILLILEHFYPSEEAI